MELGKDRYMLGSSHPWREISMLSVPKTLSDLELAKRQSFGLNLGGFCVDLRSQEEKLTPLRNTNHAKLLSQRLEEVDNEPVVILDCPGLRDDFYLNILDWSAKNNVTIALEASVYSYNFVTRYTNCITSATDPHEYISALRSIREGLLLAVANCKGCISIFDCETSKELASTAIPQRTRVAALASKHNGGMFSDHILISGSKTGKIYGYDLRNKLSSTIFALRFHELEVCGLELAQDSWLMASGSNDNRVVIWDLRREKPLFIQDDHGAAVKALAWCPWQRNLLATGSGTGDKKLRFWNTSTNSCMKTIQSDSQICGTIWSPLLPEIVVSHGFVSNELTTWSYPSLEKIIGIPAHESRILHSAISPDGTVVATTAANESLKFWKLCAKRPNLNRKERNNLSLARLECI